MHTALDAGFRRHDGREKGVLFMSGEKIKLELRGVCKAFGNNKVLQGVDLVVPEGKSLVVIGGSGTGKSVTIKCVLGLLKPDAGTILVDGKDVNEFGRDELMRKFGMLFQGGALFDSLRVWENVAFGLVQGRGMARKEAYGTAIEKLKAVGLDEKVAALYPAELSGGMQKRVGLARAVATNPEIIFFDEPTTGLDPIMADVINELIIKTVKDLGATALSITHDMASARKIADYVAMLWQGKIIWHGPVGDLDKSGNDYVDQFIHGRADGPITSVAA
jgi:phospholipid/cholesterol/gamma-HCH transport system ATP-binding protein